MKEEDLDIALKAKTLYLKLFLNRLALNLNKVFCLSLKRYY